MKARMLRRMVFLTLLATTAARGNALAEGAPQGGAREGDPKNLWVYRESVALGIPEEEMARLVADCRARGLTTMEVQRLLSLIARAKLAGLPHKDLLFKLREGLVKSASPELIDAALAGKAQTLKRAKGLVDGLIVEGYVAKDYELAIQVVGDALEIGMSPQGVLTLVRDGGSPPQGMPDPGQLFIRFEKDKK